MADAFGRALLDHHRGTREEQLVQRDGDDTRIHPVGDYYFGGYRSQPGAAWTEDWLAGPLVDIGAGAGRDALYAQRTYETVALDRSEAIVTLLRERGVEAVKHGDMFDLPTMFERGRFKSALLVGGQLGVAASTRELRELLGDLQTVTTPDATVVVDGYDPTHDGVDGKVGYRPDPEPGLAFRAYHYRYGDHVGRTVLSRLRSPNRLSEAAATAGWSMEAVHRPDGSHYYRAALERT